MPRRPGDNIPRTHPVAAGIAGAAISLLSFFTSCAAEPTTGGSSPVVLEALTIFPAGTIADWRTYGMRLITGTVTRSDEQTEEAFPGSGEGTIGRTLTVEVHETLWVDAGSWGSDLKTPSVLSIEAEGWILGEGGKRPAAFPNSTRLEVGDDYLLLLSRVPVDRSSEAQMWIVMDTTTQLRIVDGTVETPEGHPLSGVLDGRTPTQIGDLLASTAPDPGAADVMDLPPVERVTEVIVARNEATDG
jgi:hypothetical protein